MQIKVHCLITNQMPALPDEQGASWAWAVVMLGQSLYFFRLPPPTAISPNACHLSTFTYETKMATHTTEHLILANLWKNRGL